MSRLIKFLALSFVGICPIFAQESESQSLLRCLPGYPSYVFSEHVNLRLDSSTTAKVVAQLNVGEKVIVLGRSFGTLTLNGRTEHWYRVSALNRQLVLRLAFPCIDYRSKKARYSAHPCLLLNVSMG